MKTINNVFIFIDDEDNYILVNGDKKIFEKEYIKLQNKYLENFSGFAGFYDELRDILKPLGVVANDNPTILMHKYLDFNQN